MSNKESQTRVAHAGNLDRRDFLTVSAAAGSAFVLGFWVPTRSAEAAIIPGAPWYEETGTAEVNAWIVIEPDDTVTVRIAQTELGQGVWTSNAMMVCEELQCDWSKVQPEYASANRDARESAPEWESSKGRFPHPGYRRLQLKDRSQDRSTSLSGDYVDCCHTR